MNDTPASNPRRNFLRVLGSGPAAVLVGGVAGSDMAANALAQSSSTQSSYQPTYFAASEWRFLTAAVDRLIPSDENGPGGLDLDVPKFIDLQMQTTYGYGGLWYMNGPFAPDADFTLGYQLRYTPRELYRVSITDTDAYCQTNHAKDFADLDQATQDEVLTGLQKGSIELPNVKSIEFFIQLLANTKEGYFADPLYGGNRDMGSWKMIGFPGARADFKDWMTKAGQSYPLGPVSIQGET